MRGSNENPATAAGNPRVSDHRLPMFSLPIHPDHSPDPAAKPLRPTRAGRTLCRQCADRGDGVDVMALLDIDLRNQGRGCNYDIRPKTHFEPQSTDYASDMRKCDLGRELRLPFIPIIPATCANSIAATVCVREVNLASDECVRSLFPALEGGTAYCTQRRGLGAPTDSGIVQQRPFGV
jgi:hypothetical protein